jgi:hypothetical protein
LAALGRTQEARLELERAAEFPYNFEMEDFLSAFRDPNEGRKLLETLTAHGLG